MFEETKIAVKRAFEIGKLLFSLNEKDYLRLLSETARINVPSKEDLQTAIDSGMSLENAIIEELRCRYKHTARVCGLQEKYGLAMLEYAVLLDEVKNG